MEEDYPLVLGDGIRMIGNGVVHLGYKFSLVVTHAWLAILGHLVHGACLQNPW